MGPQPLPILIHPAYYCQSLWFHSPPGPRERLSRGWEKRKAWGQVASGQRVTYDLKERMCIGSMTTLESAAYQRVPTDEAEAQMLASADLDGMKSETLQHYLHYQCLCPFVPCLSCSALTAPGHGPHLPVPQILLSNCVSSLSALHCPQH